MPEPLIGTVTVAGKVFTVSEMKFASELKLGILLRQLYEQQQGNSYRRLIPDLDAMTPADRATAVAEWTRSKIANNLPGGDARELARMTPAGTALELWMRSKKYHPGLTLDEVKAIVTETNCEEVMGDIVEALTPKDGNDDDSKS